MVLHTRESVIVAWDDGGCASGLIDQGDLTKVVTFIKSFHSSITTVMISHSYSAATSVDEIEGGQTRVEFLVLVNNFLIR